MMNVYWVRRGKKEEGFSCLWENSPYISMLTCEKSREQALFIGQDRELILSSPAPKTLFLLFICGKCRGDSGNSKVRDFWRFLP